MGNLKKELILEKDNNFVTKYGTSFDDAKPEVFYLRTKAKITPSIKKDTYSEDVETIKNQFTEYVAKTIKRSRNFDDNFLSNIDISSKSVAFNKISFLRYDVYLKPTIRKSLSANKNLFMKYSLRFDNKLEKLLNKHHLCCK